MSVITNLQIYYRAGELDYYEVLHVAPSASTEEIKKGVPQASFSIPPRQESENRGSS